MPFQPKLLKTFLFFSGNHDIKTIPQAFLNSGSDLLTFGCNYNRVSCFHILTVWKYFSLPS